jgi:hypothetical protein
MTMHQLPLVAFATEHFGHPQVERTRLLFPTHPGDCPLKTHPIGDTVTRSHLKNLEVTVTARLELLRAVLVCRAHVIRTLFVASLWAEKVEGETRVRMRPTCAASPLT